MQHRPTSWMSETFPKSYVRVDRVGEKELGDVEPVVISFKKIYMIDTLKRRGKTTEQIGIPKGETMRERKQKMEVQISTTMHEEMHHDPL